MLIQTEGNTLRPIVSHSQILLKMATIMSDNDRMSLKNRWKFTKNLGMVRYGFIFIINSIIHSSIDKNVYVERREQEKKLIVW